MLGQLDIYLYPSLLLKSTCQCLTDVCLSTHLWGQSQSLCLLAADSLLQILNKSECNTVVIAEPGPGHLHLGGRGCGGCLIFLLYLFNLYF